MSLTYHSYIDGRWQEAAGGGEFEVLNPATGDLVARVANATPADIEAAIEAACRVQEAWGTLPALERATLLRAMAAHMRRRSDELASLIVAEQGKPFVQAKGELEYGIGFLDWFAEEARRVYGSTIPGTTPDKRIVILKQPVGVTAAITPWNFPAGQLLRKLGAALAAGCTMVAKPAEWTPLSALELARSAHEVGIPAGVFSVVAAEEPHEFAGAIMSDPRVRAVSFTGSTDVGKELMRGAARTMKRVSLELGGHAPLVVFDDADLDVAVSETLASKCRNMGQTCVSVNRVYVHDRVADDFTERLRRAMAGLRLGPGQLPDSDIGPLVDEVAVEKVERHIAGAVDMGASVLLGGSRARQDGLGSALYFEPTILTGVNDMMEVAREETFGPVAPILTFEDEDELVARVNNTRYGLASYFFTRDLNRAIRMSERLAFGTVGVNDASFSSVQAPFGGVKESGIGREGGQLGIDEYLDVKFVSIGHVR